MPPSDDDDQRRHFITREEASSIALAAAKEAVRQTMSEQFALLGVNIADFKDMQSLRDDLEWARRGRKLSEVTGHRIWTTIVGLAAGGLAIAFWEYARAAIWKNP
ncbi:MAG TPA: hypothetical protein VHZ78_08500 [Rhizomicrobium sp.]|jgi:hypothetical protein|nr:hypothetical protein [Rhizomicrobium sp.]